MVGNEWLPRCAGSRSATALAALALALLACMVLPALARANTLNGTESQRLGGPDNPQGLAAFDDNSGHAVVAWGDGTVDTCYVGDPPPPPDAIHACYIQMFNEFHGGVYGWNTYAEQGNWAMYVDEYDAQNVYQTTYYDSATVADAALTPTGVTSNALVGTSGSIPVGHFVDQDPHAPPGDYTATINWGDGTTVDSNVTISGSGGAAGFNVTGTHAYANPSPPGGYPVTVNIQDEPGYGSGLTASTTINSHVNATLSGSVSLSLLEGVAFSGSIAQFCGTPQPVTSATIDWGDGSAASPATSIQQVSRNGSTCYAVSAAHTYADEAAAPHTIRTTPNAGSGAAAVNGSASVAEAPLTARMDAGFLAANSLKLPGAVVAHITDANKLAPMCNTGGACDLTAEIDWGDHSGTQAATVAPDPAGGFEVVGPAHTYPGTGSYTVVVVVHDVGGAATFTGGGYTVTPPPQPRLGCRNRVPVTGATTGLYGARLPAGRPNWGISPDDRVVRSGDLVLCAADAPWIYDGPSAATFFGGGGTGGVFETHGRVIVNGLELEPSDRSATLTFDTATGTISGPKVYVGLSKETPDAYPESAGTLGTVDLGANPWAPGPFSILGVIPDGGYADGYHLNGPVYVLLDGTGTVSVRGNALMPKDFSLGPYSGGPVTSPISMPDEYPGLISGFARDRGAKAHAAVHRALDPRAHAAGGDCAYPPAPANAPIKLTSDDLFLGGVDMHCAYLFADPSTGFAEGGGGFGIGSAYVNGFIGFRNGDFDHAGGNADNLHAEIFPGLELNQIGFSVFLNPTRLHADATLLVGDGLMNLHGGTLTAFATPGHPYFYDADKAFTHNDDFSGTGSVLTNPFRTTTIGVGAEYKPLGFLDVHGYMLYQPPGYIELGGHFGYDIGIVSADGNVQGQVWLPRDFDFEGNLHSCLTGYCISGAGLVSNRGLTACANVRIKVLFVHATYSAGGSYRWGDSLPTVYIPPFSSGCDDHIGDFRVTGAADVAQAGGARSFHLAGGQHSVMVRITGAGDAPAFTVTGPGGVQATTGAENTLTGGGTIGLFRGQRGAVTWLAILHPRAGTWTITPQPGSAAITGLAIADYLPGASVHARVGGRGYDRTLHYTLRVRRGQVVRFVESGRRVTRSIAKVSASQGTIRFTPAIGPAGRRQIVAQVVRDGLLRAQYVVAGYRAPGPPTPARPPHLRLARHGSSLSITWGVAANAARGYRIIVITTDGRRQLFERPSGRRSVSLSSFSASGARVTVVGIGPDGSTGHPTAGRLQAPGRPGRVGHLTIRRRSSTQITVSWRPAARATVYLVTVTLTGSKHPSRVLTTKRSLTFRVKNVRVGATATVQGENALRVVGAKSSARLAAKR